MHAFTEGLGKTHPHPNHRTGRCYDGGLDTCSKVAAGTHHGLMALHRGSLDLLEHELYPIWIQVNIHFSVLDTVLSKLEHHLGPGQDSVSALHCWLQLQYGTPNFDLCASSGYLGKLASYLLISYFRWKSLEFCFCKSLIRYPSKIPGAWSLLLYIFSFLLVPWSHPMESVSCHTEKRAIAMDAPFYFLASLGQLY